MARNTLKPAQQNRSLPPTIEKVTHGKNLFAIIIRSSLPARGHQFLTQPSNPLQLGVLDFPAHHQIPPHRHIAIEKTVKHSTEVIHLQFGLLKLCLFSNQGEKFYETHLEAGDAAVLINGGHSFEFLQNTRLIEVKQGPYSPEDGTKIPL